MKDYCCSKFFEPYYLDAMKNKKTASITTVIIAVAVIIFQYIDQNWSDDNETNFTELVSEHGGSSINASNAPIESNNQIETLYANKQSDTVVEINGEVIKLLADDNQGSRHQKFIMELPSGHTLLVSHNIDLAPKINSLRENDTVKIKGEYEWSERGGVIHWTHHDPAGRHEDGWIEHQGKRYY